jgi:hypothetical protein
VGWTAYYAPHFTIAVPPGWRVEAHWNAKDPQPEWWNLDYLLYSPQQQDARGGVFEWDDLSGVLVRDNFCRRTAGYEMGTVAGLSVRVGPPRGHPGEFDRNWTFINNQKTVYGLWLNDEPLGYYGYRNKSENSAIIETFAPQYTTWGCA